MEIQAVALLIMVILLCSVGLFVFFKGRKSIINRLYGLFAIFMAVWAFGLLMFYTGPENMLRFWANFLYVAGTLIAAIFFYFSLVFPFGRMSKLTIKGILIFFPNIALFILFFFSDFILAGTFIGANNARGFVYGPGHLLFDIQFSLFFIWGFLNLLKKYRPADNIAKTQLKFTILGTSLGLLIAGPTNVILPWFGVFQFLWLGPVAALIWITFTAYAILKHHLFDIKVIATEIFAALIPLIILFYVIFPDNSLNLLLKLILFVIITIFSVFLVRGVLKEVEAKEALERLNQAKSEFLNLASHQLRTPVSVIKGVASMMKEGSFDKFPKDKQTTFIGGLYDKTLKLEDIINDILNASEMTSVKFKVTPERAELVDSETLVSEIVKGFEPKLIERQIELNVHIDNKPLPKIICQQEFLKDALGNLIENAIKYTPSAKSDRYTRDTREGKAEINVSVFKKDDNIVFQVQDNGIGIPKNEIATLFKKFQRGSNARNMYTDGSGLGLYIVREIVEGHGGKVWVESEINKGSSFFISLPINPPKEINIKQSIVEEAAEEAGQSNV